MNIRQYLTNWSLYVRGFRYLWTRRYESPVQVTGIYYKPGWGPWRFLPVYLTTYLLGTLAGFGVQSLSGAWGERASRVTVHEWHYFTDGSKASSDWDFTYPHSRRLARAVDWFFEKVLRQGPGHCAKVGPRLWGSRSVWE